MPKKANSMRIVLRSNYKQKDKSINLAAIFVYALLMIGTLLTLQANFESFNVSLPLAVGVLMAAGVIFMFLYTKSFGNWVLPIGICALFVISIAFSADILSGTACFANDFLDILTAKTGKIYLDMANENSSMILPAFTVAAMLFSILFSRSAWSARPAFAFIVLVPIYAGLIFGIIKPGIETGILAAGTILLFVLRTGRANYIQKAFVKIPLYLLIFAACIALGYGVSLKFEDKLNKDIKNSIEKKIHEKLYDSPQASMPEGNLKNLDKWEKNDTPAIEVTMDSPQKLYLRGAVYEEYTGREWKEADPEKRAEYEDLFYWLHESDFYGQTQIAKASEFTGNVTPAVMTVKNLAACSEHGYHPYALYESDALDKNLIGDAKTGAEESFTYIPGSLPEWYGVQQNISSAQNRSNISDYLKQEQSYAEYIKATDLQLTQDSWAVIDRQIEADQSQKSLADIRIIIRDYLKEAVVYDENTKTLNGNSDFLKYTLENSGSGYSVHYATAATLMLRYFGVPARYVEGYFLSAEDAARYEAGETIVLTEEHAHAWAEYYLNGVGFVPFEVTPGYMDDEEDKIGGSLALNEDNYAGSSLGFAQVKPPEDIKEQSKDSSIFSMKKEYIVLMIIAVLIIFALIIIYRRRRLAKKLNEIKNADARSGIAMQYGYAEYIKSHCDIDAFKDDENAKMLNCEALFSDHEMSETQRQEMDEYTKKVLSACKEKWSWTEKLRYRLWDCIY